MKRNDDAQPCSGMAPTGEMTLGITSDPRWLPTVRAAVQRSCEDKGFTNDDAQSITWAVDEALTNIIRHGYGNRNDQPISLTLLPFRDQDGRSGVKFTLRDQGRQVNPDSIQGRDLNDIRPGGLGVHVIKSVMDHVEYTCPEQGGMQLIMVKYTNESASDSKKDGSSPSAAQSTEAS